MKRLNWSKVRRCQETLLSLLFQMYKTVFGRRGTGLKKKNVDGTLIFVDGCDFIVVLCFEFG